MPTTYEFQVEEYSYSSTYKRIAIIAAAILLGCVVVIVLAVTVPNSGNSPDEDDIPYYSFNNLTLPKSYAIPCISNGVQPAGCTGRFVSCGTSNLDGAVAVIPPAEDTYCKSVRSYVGEICIL
jgi:hypothetical protein